MQLELISTSLNMQFPEELYPIIGESILKYSHSNSNYEKKQIRNNLISVIASNYEYKDIKAMESLIIPDSTIGLFNDLDTDIAKYKSDAVKSAQELIEKYHLEEYQDVILANTPLTISALLKVVQYVWYKTHNIIKACAIYAQLGYPSYKHRFQNIDYIVNLIQSWTQFCSDKNFIKEKIQYLLLSQFEEIDDENEGIFIIRTEDLDICGKTCETNVDLDIESKIIKYQYLDFTEYLSFSSENYNKLIDILLKRYDFETADEDEYIDWRYGSEESEVQRNEYRYFGIGIDPIALFEFYSFLLNKANQNTPNSLFTICLYTKYLESNFDTIKQFLPELNDESLKSIISDYAKDAYSYYSPCESDMIDYYTYQLLSAFKHTHNDAVDILYDIKEKRPLSIKHLTDIWQYIVLDSKLSFSKGFLNQTSLNFINIPQNKYSLNGNILLSWKYVRFFDGKAFFYHPLTEKSSKDTKILPYKLELDFIKKNFAELPKRILYSFPPIECTCLNGKIEKIDIPNVEYVLSSIAFIYDQYSVKKETTGSYYNITAEDVLIQYKNEALDYLNKIHKKTFPIHVINENVINLITKKEEKALLFCVGDIGETLTLVYENTSISRASYIFIVSKEKYLDAYKAINSYFASSEVNKRLNIANSRDMFTIEDGIFRVIRLPHTNLIDWKTAISFYAKSNK